jgi:hypothetical protein
LVSFSSKFPLFIGLNFRSLVFKWWDAGWREKMGPKGVSAEFVRVSSLRDFSYHWAYKFYLFVALFISIF